MTDPKDPNDRDAPPREGASVHVLPLRKSLIERKGPPDGLLHLIVDRSAPKCQHPRIRFLRADHVAFCAVCNVQVDPFEVMVRFAREEELHQRRWEEVSRDVRIAENRLAQLKRLERNARARLKRIAGEVPATWALEQPGILDRITAAITEVDPGCGVELTSSTRDAVVLTIRRIPRSVKA